MQGSRKTKPWKKGLAYALLPALMLAILYLASNDRDSGAPVHAARNQSSEGILQLDDTPLPGPTQAASEPKITTIEQKTSEILVGQLVSMKRPNWKLEGGVLPHLENLLKDAALGDNEARYILGVNFRYCYSSPIDNDALEKKLEETYELSDGAHAATRIEERYNYCSGIDTELRKQFYHYIRIAAQDGHVASQETFGTITPKFFMISQGHNGLGRDEYIAERDNFVQLKTQILENAAQNGSIRALIQLSNMHHAQTLGRSGHVKSFALNTLIVELTRDNEVYNRYNWFIQRQYDNLSMEEKEQATKLSTGWLDVINKNGTIYPRE